MAERRRTKTTDDATETLYVATKFVDDDGEHEVNSEFEMPTSTPEERVTVERLVSYGILSREPVEPRSDTED